MYDKIKSDIVSAMKEKDTLKLQTLRGVKGEIDLAHNDKKVEINDELVTDVLSHQIKTRIYQVLAQYGKELKYSIIMVIQIIILMIIMQKENYLYQI